MTQEILDITKSRAAELLQMPKIKEGLRGVFEDLESLYGQVREGTVEGDGAEKKATITNLGLPSVTPSGIYIEVVMVAHPRPERGAPAEEFSAFHDSKKLIVTVFDMSKVSQEGFKVKPVVVEKMDRKYGVSMSRGVDVDIVFPYDQENDPRPPEESEEARESRRERNQQVLANSFSDPLKESLGKLELSPVESWLRRNTIQTSIPTGIQGDPDRPVSYRGETAIPFKELRQKLGISL